MNANHYPGAFPDEGDLALYSMGSLVEADAAAVSERLAQDVELRGQLASIELALGLYAESTITVEAAPAGSRDRLLRAISSRKAVLPFSSQGIKPAALNTRHHIRPLHWAGWAIAAALLVATGVQYQRGTALRRDASDQQARLAHAGTQSAQLAQERDSLRGQLEQQVRQANASRSEALGYKNQSAELQARVANESARAQQANERAGASLEAANAVSRERNQLLGSLAAQQAQVARLNAQAATAKQITDALSDPAALRVSLTVPKQKKQPSGRGTYVPGTGTLLFAASDLAPLRQGQVYELWLLPADGSSPVPAGTFVPDASGNATVLSGDFRKAIAASGFAVTVEPAGGSLKPTSPILLVGQA